MPFPTPRPFFLFLVALFGFLLTGAPPVNPAFRDLDGRRHELHDATELPAVYVFLSTECPISNKYLPRVVSLERVYRAKGFHFFAVYPNSTESAEAVAKHSKERGIPFPVVRDEGVLTHTLKATTTPEAVLLDRAGKVRYQGRIDDNADSTQVTSHDLAKALDALLTGKPVPVAETRPFGCVIPSAVPTPTVTTPLTYAHDIAPILYAKCLPCHRAGEVAPFALDTYERAVRWASQMKQQTAARKMPPWKADSHGEFHDELRLSDREREKLAQWADGGAPRGDPKELPPLPKFPTGWKIGNPDAIFEVPESYSVPAEGKDEYRCFIIPSGFTEDRWIAGVEYHPGNRAVVHHMSAFVDTTGQARKMAEADKSKPGYRNPTPGNGPGFTPVAGQLGGWVPGHFPRMLPEGVGIRVPKGADIVIECHYHPTGKAETDRSKIGLRFAPWPVKQRLYIGDVSNVNFRIPAGEKKYVAEFSAFVPENITLLSVSPHMHNLGRSMKATVTFPDGTTKTLIDVPDWDFNWQPSYRFKERLKLPRRARIDVVATFDNSAENPNNPHRPPKDVTWGEGTGDEMCTLFVAYTRDDEDLTVEPVLVP